MADNREGPDPLLRVSGLQKRYGAVEAVKGIDFTVEAGSFFGLLGPNGAGKTTVLESVLGLRRPDAGQTHLLGCDPADSGRNWRRAVGVQLQSSQYPDRIKVGELIRLYEALYGVNGDGERLAGLFGLHSLRKRRVEELSGGEKQRLALLLALQHRPRILFLDELTTGLDAAARREVWAVLTGLKREGLTVVLTTHYMEEAEILCDEILVMQAGRTVAAGSVADVRARTGAERLEEAYLNLIGYDGGSDESLCRTS